jgi:hypothetical protein
LIRANDLWQEKTIGEERGYPPEGNGIKCPNCGGDGGNDFGAFCEYCGASLRVQPPTPKTRRWIARAVALTIAVVGIFMLVGGLALCFMSVQESYNYYGMPIYHTTYPYRDTGFVLATIGSIVGIVGFAGFLISKYRHG